MTGFDSSLIHLYSRCKVHFADVRPNLSANDIQLSIELVRRKKSQNYEIYIYNHDKTVDYISILCQFWNMFLND